jgi:hypothetical protein
MKSKIIWLFSVLMVCVNVGYAASEEKTNPYYEAEATLIMEGDHSITSIGITDNRESLRIYFALPKTKNLLPGRIRFFIYNNDGMLSQAKTLKTLCSTMEHSNYPCFVKVPVSSPNQKIFSINDPFVIKVFDDEDKEIASIEKNGGHV